VESCAAECIHPRTKENAMPNFKVIVRGGLITAKGKPNIAHAALVEMSQEEADSLPPGTVEPIGKPVELKKEK